MKMTSKEFVEALARANDTHNDAWAERTKWVPLWSKLAKNFYPMEFRGLNKVANRQDVPAINMAMVDNAPAIALVTLAAGYMNGVTSPARKWVNVANPASTPYDDVDHGQTEGMTAVREKILEILAASNYYSSRAVEVYEGAGLGTSLVLAYPDRDTVVKFMHCPPGSFALVTDQHNLVRKIARKERMRLKDIIDEFGEESIGKELLARFKESRTAGRVFYEVNHLVEDNESDGLTIARSKYRELYWLTGVSPETAPAFLAVRPLYEWPASVFRWDCPDGSTYGIPPTTSALGRAISLQTSEYRIDQGLDKMVTPPMLAHHTLKSRPKAFHAGGITYSADLSAGAGARPLYNTTMPFQELDYRRTSIVNGINEALFTPLFKSISDLETVRSATEIDARREEKLVMLGPVLHRNYKEDLEPIILRVIGIATRAGVMPQLGEGEVGVIVFKNILADVQKASEVSTIERFFGFTSSIIQAFPEVQQEVDASRMLRNYAEGLGLDPRSMKPKEEAAQANEAANQLGTLSQVSEIAKNFGGAASGLSNDDVGGGLAAVQSML